MENQPEARETRSTKDRIIDSAKKSRGLLLAECEGKENKILLEKIKNNKEWFKKEYGIKVEFLSKKEKVGTGEWQGTNNDFYAEPSSLRQSAELLENIKTEIIKIPLLLFKKMKISKMVICKNITRGKTEIAGFMKMRQKNAEFYIQNSFCFFHELFHQIDFLDGGRHSILTTSVRKNMKWLELGGETEVSFKTLTFADEEQCDYFAYLFNLDKGPDWYKKKLIYLNKNNPINPRKLGAMKKFLLEWSGGLLNEQYWKDLTAGKVDRNYWAKKH